MENTRNIDKKERKKGFTGSQVFAIVVGTVVITLLAAIIAVRVFLFPQPFEPVVLTAVEQENLDVKLDRLDPMATTPDSVPSSPENEPEKELSSDGRLVPQKYSEDDASRDVSFTERELNALVATNTDLADKLAIDLADDLVSVRMRIPVDQDFPVFGGKTLRLRSGVEMAYREGRPVVKLRGISLMGVPVPNAWLGNMKNVDLVREFSNDKGFWKAFGDGVESIRVEEDKLTVRLKK